MKYFLLVFFSSVYLAFGFDSQLFANSITNSGSEESKKSQSMQGKWSYTMQAGWVTNIDYVLNSSSKNYRFDDNTTGINGTFKSYDSREQLNKLEGDQANNYLITIKNEVNGITFTTGILHDKREQTPNKTKNKFRYESGGLSPALMLGYQLDYMPARFCSLGAQLKAGGFINFDRIAVDLYDPTQNRTYSTLNNKRSYSGGGFVAMAVFSYNHVITDSWSLSLMLNGTFMAGTATTKAYSINHFTGKVNNGQLSVKYASLTVGPSIGITFRR